MRTCISPNWAVPATELALKSARTYRASVDGTEIFTVLSSPGPNTYCAEDLSVAKLLPSSLPWSASVCLRVCQPSGSRSTTCRTRLLLPRSVCTHWADFFPACQ